MSRINRPNVITSYLTDEDGKQYYIPAQCSFNKSSAWETREKRATDSTKTIQNISIMLKRGRQPSTIQLSFVLSKAFEDSNLYQLLYEYESLVGRNVEVVYSNKSFGRFIVENGTFALNMDYSLGASTLSVSLNLKESIVYVPQKTGNITFQ